MHVKFGHIYIIDCGHQIILLAASGVYSCYQTSLDQALVDLCLSSQQSLCVICPLRGFLICAADFLSSRTTQHANASCGAFHIKSDI